MEHRDGSSRSLVLENLSTFEKRDKQTPQGLDLASACVPYRRKMLLRHVDVTTPRQRHSARVDQRRALLKSSVLKALREERDEPN